MQLWHWEKGDVVFNQSWHLEHNLFCRILRLTQGIFGSQMGFLKCFFGKSSHRILRITKPQFFLLKYTVLLWLCFFYYSASRWGSSNIPLRHRRKIKKKFYTFYYLYSTEWKKVKANLRIFFSQMLSSRGRDEYGVIICLRYIIAKVIYFFETVHLSSWIILLSVNYLDCSNVFQRLLMMENSIL